MRTLITLICLLVSIEALAQSLREIIRENTSSLVYLEIKSKRDQNVLDTGTGFIISQDGYILTAAHLKVAADQQMFAVIGERVGIPYPLLLREADEASDIALWKLPQSQICRDAAVLSTVSVELTDHIVILGFPGAEGLTPVEAKIINVASSQRGFYKANSLLRPGNSGGPVFNDTGQVIAIVQGGTLPGTDNNDLIPIAPAISLIRKWGIKGAIDVPGGSNKCVRPDPTRADVSAAIKTALGEFYDFHINRDDFIAKARSDAFSISEDNTQISVPGVFSMNAHYIKTTRKGGLERIGLFRGGRLLAIQYSQRYPAKQFGYSVPEYFPGPGRGCFQTNSDSQIHSAYDYIANLTDKDNSDYFYYDGARINPANAGFVPTPTGRSIDYGNVLLYNIWEKLPGDDCRESLWYASSELIRR